MTQRISGSLTRPAPLSFRLDGREVTAHEGETLATVILLSGDPVCRLDRTGAPRAPFCNMGVCYDCLVTVTDPSSPGQPLTVRACMTPVKAGLKVETCRLARDKS